MGVTLKVFNFSEVMICPWKEETEGPLQVDHKCGGLWRILPLINSVYKFFSSYSGTSDPPVWFSAIIAKFRSKGEIR